MLTTPQLAKRDVEVVMEQAGVNKQQAIKALANNKRNIANAIMDLTEPNG